MQLCTTIFCLLAKSTGKLVYPITYSDGVLTSDKPKRQVLAGNGKLNNIALNTSNSVVQFGHKNPPHTKQKTIDLQKSKSKSYSSQSIILQFNLSLLHQLNKTGKVKQCSKEVKELTVGGVLNKHASRPRSKYLSNDSKLQDDQSVEGIFLH